MNMDQEIAALRQMTVKELRVKHREVFGEPTRAGHKAYLVKRIAWRMQANAEGSLTQRALRRAKDLADDGELRTTAPGRFEPLAIEPEAPKPPPPELTPGVELERRYKGRLIVVKVVEGGFEHEGTVYRSLTAVAKAITGSHWNGPAFFGLRKRGDA